MLGTKTADNTVIASNSLCNKDYTGLGNNVLIGGIPSKLIKNNFKRDWEIEKEHLMKSKRVVIKS
jgi:serine acetyltransferase